MTKFELEQELKKHKFIKLEDFLRQVRLTEDEFIDIVCNDEIHKIESRYKKSILTAQEASEASTISYATIMRHKKDNKIKFSQEKEGAPILFSSRNIAIEMYKKSHPIEQNKITFTNLLREL